MNIWFTILLNIVLAVLALVLFDRIQNRRKWRLLEKIPGPIPVPLLGNLKELGVFNSASKHVSQFTLFLQARLGLSQIYRREKMFKLWFGRTACVVLIHPDTVQPFLSKSNCLEKGFIYNFMTPIAGLGLLTSSGEKWRTDRKRLTPAFHLRTLEDFISVINKHANILVHNLRTASKTSEWLDPVDLISTCTLDIICEATMNCKIEEQENQVKYTEALDKLQMWILERVMKPWLSNEWLYFKTKEGKKFTEEVQVIKSFSNGVIARNTKQQESNIEAQNECKEALVETKRPVFLDILLNAYTNKNMMSDQVSTLIIGGFDTTTTVLTWTFYLLGLHPDVQEKLSKEVDQVMGPDDCHQVNMNQLKNLKYMDCVIKEVLRLYPPVPLITRILPEDTMIGAYLVPKGTEVEIPIYALHRNPDVFEDPDTFNPERFLIENCGTRNPFAFIPFSAGPRNCIGQKFAMMELRLTLCHIIRHFRLQSLDERDKVQPQFLIFLKSTRPLRIKFFPR